MIFIPGYPRVLILSFDLTAIFLLVLLQVALGWPDHTDKFGNYTISYDKIPFLYPVSSSNSGYLLCESLALYFEGLMKTKPVQAVISEKTTMHLSI